MVCQKCQQREATVHITTMIDDDMTKSDFCVECAREMPHLAAVLPCPQFSESHTFRDELIRSLGRHRLYPIEAYEFVLDALGIRNNIPQERSAMETLRNASGKEVLEMIRQAALEKFSKEAKGVLWSWNIFRTEDFGEIIFEMIDAGILAKGPGDSKDDYRNGFGFEEVFPEA
jgi:uncharacterized repeat protein (TIGR04138 family)